MSTNRFVLSADYYSAPAADTAATVTVPAQPGNFIVLQGLQWSYDDTPTGGALTITINGVVVWGIDIAASGPGAIVIPSTGWRVAFSGHTAVITLTAGGAAVSGSLNVQAIHAPE